MNQSDPLCVPLKEPRTIQSAGLNKWHTWAAAASLWTYCMSEAAAERMKLGPSNNTPELESSHQALSQRPGYLSSTCSPGPKSESKSESSRRDSVQFLHVKNDDTK